MHADKQRDTASGGEAESFVLGSQAWKNGDARLAEEWIRCAKQWMNRDGQQRWLNAADAREAEEREGGRVIGC